MKKRLCNCQICKAVDAVMAGKSITWKISFAGNPDKEKKR